MKRLNLVLPAAGMGNRFKAVGNFQPKPLIEVFGIPMIIWVLSNFKMHTNDKIWIISQEKDKLPSAILNKFQYFPWNIEFIEIDGLTEGPASTVDLALDRIPDSESLIVANSDQYIFSNLETFISEVRGEESIGQILSMTASSNAWSYIGRDSNGAIERVVEKIQISTEATVGVYGWSSALEAKKAFNDTFERNIRTNNEFYVAPTYNYLIANGKKVESFNIGEHGIDVHGLGTPKDLESFLLLESAKLESIRILKLLNPRL